MSEGPRRHQHFVSRSLLAQWQQGDSPHVCLADKEARSLKEAGPRDVFAGKHLYSVKTGDGRDDWLEREWEAIETAHLPGVDRFRRGSTDDVSQQSVRTIMALHLSRSRVVADFRRAQTEERIARMVEGAPERTQLLDAYEEQYGERPTATAVQAALEDHASTYVETNALDVELIVHSFNSGVEFLSDFFVQRVEVEQFSTVRLFIGDSPVVVSRRGRVSAADQPVAVGDADEVFMPLGPTVAAALSKGPVAHKRGLAPAEAKRMNRYTVDAAKRHFVARHAKDIRASLRACSDSFTWL